MFVNVRVRKEAVVTVRAGVSEDADPLSLKDGKVQPIYIEAVYRLDTVTGQRLHYVQVTARYLRRNGMAGERETVLTWQKGNAEMPEWAARFLMNQMPCAPSFS